jgi:hypothetical protein
MAFLNLAEVKERLLGMSGFFETSTGYPDCYGVSSGNHDGAGLSFGVLQFNLGTGSLQPLWSYLNTNYNTLCRDTLNTYYDEWASVITMPTAEAIAWGDSISVPLGNDPKRGVTPEWYNRLKALGVTQPSIDRQQIYAESWYPNAEKWFKTLGLWSRRGLALTWDYSVQMGRMFPLNQIYADFLDIDTTGKTKEQIELEKLYIILNRATYDNRPKDAATSKIVYDRKIMIVEGTGDYWGATFDMAQYDLGFEPALAENMAGGIYIGG